MGSRYLIMYYPSVADKQTLTGFCIFILELETQLNSYFFYADH